MGVQIVKLLDKLQIVNIPSGLVPLGAYDNGTDYAVGDSVSYNGSSYVMYSNAGAGTLPTDTTKWQVLANKGTTGATGATGPQGDPGTDGTDGTDGAAGVGVPTGGTTGQVLSKASNTNYDTAWSSAGAGDMAAAVYDPQAIADDAFDQDNMTDGTTNKNFTATEKTKLAAISGTNTGDQTLPVKATGAELDTATDDAKFATAKAIKDAHNVPSVAPSTAGKLMRSDGTDWTSAAVTTADVAASTNKNYVTDAQQTVIGNTSGTNTGDQTLGSLGAAASGANTDITSVLLNQTGLVVKGADTNALTIKPNETLTAARTLNLKVNDAARTIDLSGNLTVSSAATISGTNTGDQTLPTDATITTTDVTTNDASTTKHGWLIKATAPASGLMNFVGITNGETVYANKPLFDTTNPAALGTAGPGTQVIAARRDHVHANPAIDTLAAATDITTLNASTTAHGLVVKATAPAANKLNTVGIANGETAYTNKTILDSTTPSTQAFGDAAAAGTNLDASHSDHKHAMPATPTSVSGNAGTATALATPRAIYGNNFDGTAALAQVIASTYGGTGNGFTKFSGPTTAEKTFTLPDASSTIVVQGGALGTPSSGTLTNCTFPTLNQNTSGTAANLSGTPALPNGTTATTQSANDNSTKLATTAYADLKLPKAGGTMSGDITLGENTSIALDPAGSADGKYSGITVTAIGGATIAFGDLVTLDKDDSRWELVDISVAAAATGDARGILGMAVTSSSDGAALTVLLHGIIRADANFPALTIGAPVYASTTGDVVVTQPTTTDHVIRVIGFGMTADELYFNPDNAYITHT